MTGGNTTVVLDRVVLLYSRNQRLLDAYAGPATNFRAEVIAGKPGGC